MINSIKEIVKNNLCLGCGLCHYSGLKLVYSKKKGLFIPEFSDSDKQAQELAYDICPAKGYEIVSKGGKLFNDKSEYCLELGYFKKCYASHSLNIENLKNASSGGIITEILIFLLQQQLVAKVLVTKIVYTSDGPRSKSFLTNDYKEIRDAQGSKYCPVNMADAIEEIVNFRGDIAVVATPCVIAGLLNIQEKDSSFLKIKYTISNFCGGYKDYRNVESLLKIKNIGLSDVKYFRFRGGGQPGSMLIKTSNFSVSMPYPDYTGYTGFSKILRCHFCVDATGELADFACGDAWQINRLDSCRPWSIVIARNNDSIKILNQMRALKSINLVEITADEIIESQEQNINSKKYRQSSRLILYGFLLYKLPHIKEGYLKRRSPYITELKVFISHKLKLVLQLLGVYYAMIKRHNNKS